MAVLAVKRFRFAVADIVKEPLPLPRDGEMLGHVLALLVTSHDPPAVTSIVMLLALFGNTTLVVDTLKLGTGVGVRTGTSVGVGVCCIGVGVGVLYGTGVGVGVLFGADVGVGVLFGADVGVGV